MKFLKCVNNKDYPVDLQVGKIYESFPCEEEGLVRVVDESGEDYLFDEETFCEPTRKDFLDDIIRIDEELELYEED